MAANQVVLYFENQNDALRFTLAASSVISADDVQINEAVVKIAQEICKASRITTEGSLSLSSSGPDSPQPAEHCA
jgi:hypothetical protein